MVLQKMPIKHCMNLNSLVSQKELTILQTKHQLKNIFRNKQFMKEKSTLNVNFVIKSSKYYFDWNTLLVHEGKEPCECKICDAFFKNVIWKHMSLCNHLLIVKIHGKVGQKQCLKKPTFRVPSILSSIFCWQERG